MTHTIGNIITYKKVQIPQNIKNRFEFIGKGMFSIALRQNNIVYLRSKCIYKEAMSLFLEEHDNLPNINSLHFEDNYGFSWYSMPFYEEISKEENKKIKKLCGSFTDTRIKRYKVDQFPVDTCRYWLEYVIKTHNEFNKWYEPLYALMECTLNYDLNCMFEFSKRNVGTLNNNIIFRDVIYSTDQIDKIRRERIAKQYSYKTL